MKIRDFKVIVDADEIGIAIINSAIIETIQLQEVNLLVGKNASGKTTVGNYLDFFSKIMTGTGGRFLGHFIITFIDDDNSIIKYAYFASMSDIKESLYWNDTMLIERKNNKEARIYSENLNDFETVNPPENTSILVSRRDAKAYPYIEKLIAWANGVFSLRFGHMHPSYLIGIGGIPRGQDIYTSQKDFNSYLGEISPESKKLVINELNTLGYNVLMIDFVKYGEQYEVNVFENGISHPISEYIISQGMFRALWVLLYFNYLIEKQKASLIIIDDLCEGLDYSRATSLGKLVFNKMKEKGVQFVATSNDSFLMNVVDIKYWNIISRKNKTIFSYNYGNCKEKFDKFNLMGLNNFDLFTSNFLETNNEENSSIR